MPRTQREGDLSILMSHVSQNQTCTEQDSCCAAMAFQSCCADQELLQKLSEINFIHNASQFTMHSQHLAANAKNWRSVAQALDSFGVRDKGGAVQLLASGWCFVHVFIMVHL